MVECFLNGADILFIFVIYTCCVPELVGRLGTKKRNMYLFKI